MPTTKTIYVADHALSDGVQTIKNAKVYAEGEEGEFATGKRDTSGVDQEEKWERKEFFDTQDEAIAEAKRRRLNYMDSMQSNIEKWMGFKFDHDHLKYEAPPVILPDAEE